MNLTFAGQRWRLFGKKIDLRLIIHPDIVDVGAHEDNLGITVICNSGHLGEGLDDISGVRGYTNTEKYLLKTIYQFF